MKFLCKVRAIKLINYRNTSKTFAPETKTDSWKINFYNVFTKPKHTLKQNYNSIFPDQKKQDPAVTRIPDLTIKTTALPSDQVESSLEVPLTFINQVNSISTSDVKKSCLRKSISQ